MCNVTESIMAVQSQFKVNSKSTKVVDFDTNRKRVCDFLLLTNSNLGPSYLARFREYGGLEVENR